MATTKHPDLPKAKEWHREHVHRQGSKILPRTFRVPTGNGKIGAGSKVEIIHALHRKDDEGRRVTSGSSDRITRTLTLTHLVRDLVSGDRRLHVERVHHDLSGECR